MPFPWILTAPSTLCLCIAFTDVLPPPVVSQPATYQQAASVVTASIQKQFFNDKTGLYAQSADKADPEYMWGNGVMFSALVAAARHEPETYRPIMDRFFAGMHAYWDARAKVPGYEPAPTQGDGHDKYYDDNQWMVITFLEAFDLTRDQKYLDRARATLHFSLSGWDDQLGGGIWWHAEHKGGCKNTCANAPAAVACLRMARHHHPQENNAWARKIVRWTSEHLQDQDGLFFDNQRVADGHVDKKKYTYNTALMMRANIGLHRASGDAAFLTEARRIGEACDFFNHKTTGIYHDGMKFTHLLVEADLELYRATGEEQFVSRARRNGDAAWKLWQTNPPRELIEQAALARMLWLLADHDSEVGRKFWAESDRASGPQSPSSR